MGLAKYITIDAAIYFAWRLFFPIGKITTLIA
jgi:hypothetical protein